MASSEGSDSTCSASATDSRASSADNSAFASSRAIDVPHAVYESQGLMNQAT